MNGDTTRARIRELVTGGAGSLQQLADQLGVRPQTVHEHLGKMSDAAEVRAQMAANRRQQAQLIEAHGESKTYTAWARDPRCVVSVNTLRARRTAGWTLEDAMDTPAATRPRAALTAAETAALKAAADLVRVLPHVHRNTAADAPERAAVRARNRLMRAAAGKASVAEIARAVGLTHGRAWACIHEGEDRDAGTA